MILLSSHAHCSKCSFERNNRKIKLNANKNKSHKIKQVNTLYREWAHVQRHRRLDPHA